MNEHFMMMLLLFLQGVMTLTGLRMLQAVLHEASETSVMVHATLETAQAILKQVQQKN